MNHGFTVQGSDLEGEPDHRAAGGEGRDGLHRPEGGEPRGRAGGGDLLGDQDGQSRARRGAGEEPAGGAAGGDAGRADAAEVERRGRRDARQDHDDLDGGGAARRRRHGPDGGQRRGDPRLRLERADRAGRVDGGRGRRERRQLRQAAGDDRDRHQHRPRASRPLRRLRGDQGGVRHLRLEHPVLRARGLLHRPPGGAGAGRADHRPAGRDLRLQPAGRRAGPEPRATRTAARASTWR